VLVAVAAVLFGIAFSYPILLRFGELAVHQDWDLLWQLQWVAYHSVAHFDQLPLWNPYKCGGMPLLANPHSRIVTPFFLLHALFGPVVGLQLEVPLHLAIGFGGGYVLARVLGLGRLPATLCAVVFPASSWFSLHVAVGHVVFLPSMYLPWIAALLCVGFGRRTLSPAVGAGLLGAFTLGEGGVYAVPHALFLVATLGLTVGAMRRSVQPLMGVLAFGVSTLGFAAIKAFPMLALMRAHPRVMYSDESTPAAFLLTALFSRNQEWTRDSPEWLFHEYGAYVGVGAGLLAVLGALASPRRALPWIVAAAAFLVLALGDFGPASPWVVLHQLPVFSSGRVPTRWLIPFTLVAGVLAAFGLETLRQRVRLYGAILTGVVVAVLVLDLWLVGPPNLRHAFRGRAPALPGSAEFRQMRGKLGGGYLMLAHAKANLGSVGCDEYVAFPSLVLGADDPAYRGEHYLVGDGTARALAWTPNVLSYEVDMPGPGILVVNQNFDPGWHLAAGEGEVVAHDSLLAIRLPAKTQRLTLAYRGNRFREGLAITILTAVAWLLLIRREATRPRAAGPLRGQDGADR
jgi:hypothetical protein